MSGKKVAVGVCLALVLFFLVAQTEQSVAVANNILDSLGEGFKALAVFVRGLF